MNSSQKIKYFYPIKPNNQRILTDTYCFAIYILIAIASLSLFFYSFINEKDNNLLHPRDPDGRRCQQQYPYIYFIDPTSQQTLSKAVCVKNCPRTTNNQQNTAVQCQKNKLVKSCSQIQLQSYQTKTNDLLMMCQPVSQKLSTIIYYKIYHEYNMGSAFRELKKFYDARYAIGILCPSLCMILMFSQLILIYCCKNVKGLFMINFTALIIVILFFAVRLLLLKQSEKFTGSTVLGVMALIPSLFLIVYVLRNIRKLRRSLDYLNICSDFIRQNKKIIVLPLTMFFVWILSFVVSLAIFTFIIAIGTSSHYNNLYTFPYQISSSNKTLVWIAAIIAILNYVWICLIIQHIGKYVSIVGASNWIMHTPKHFQNALYTLFRYHLGSLLTGSVLINSYSWLSELMYFFVPNHKNKLCCCHAQKLAKFYRTECFLSLIGLHTDMTYLMIGLNGESYWEGGKKISQVLVENTRILSQTYIISKIVIKACQWFVALLVTLICYQYLIMSHQDFKGAFVILTIFIISYLLASFGLDPYNLAYQSILLTIMINKTDNFREKQQIAEFPIAKSTAQDSRLSIYENIEKWVEEQTSHNKYQEPSTTNKSPINSTLQK